jgi:hypothetical protein
VYIYIYVSIYLSIHPSIHLSIYLSNTYIYTYIDYTWHFSSIQHQTSHPRHLDGGAKDRVEDRDLALGVDVEIFPLEVRRGPGKIKARLEVEVKRLMMINDD